MSLKKLTTTRRKWKFLFLLSIIVAIVLTLIIFSSTKKRNDILLGEQFVEGAYIVGGGNIIDGRVKPEVLNVLKSPQRNGVIEPEKYNAAQVKTRIIEEKIKSLKNASPVDDEVLSVKLDTITTAVHIFYTAPIQWYKTRKTQTTLRENLLEEGDLSVHSTHKPVRVLNTAFYPARGLYKPTQRLLQQHFESIKNCGVGVLILNYVSEQQELYARIIDLAASHNLSVTFEINAALNQSVEYFREQLWQIRRFRNSEGFYRVFAMTRGTTIPVIYVSNAYKLADKLGRLLCATHPDSIRHTMDAYFIGHIRLKNHADIMRRLCFDGYYSRLPSNGANFASTWKNWSYLKSFAITYKMLYVPTVGPGFAERNKFPRHGDIQRHRSNGRYYGVAWRTAILNHVGFINIASFNNWPEGSQIEEVIPKAGYLDYSPGERTKYLELTAHWVNNFLKSRKEAIAVHVNCYELLNNTIC